MFNGKGTQCVINPTLGQERRASDARRPASRQERVLIVGGGPAGCEAAILAAERGHSVRLVERADRIGGQLLAWAAASPFRMEVKNMIAFYESELERVGVDVHLNTDAADLDLSPWDTVLLATGTVAQDRGPDVADMLASANLPVTDEVTVFGETEAAMFAALWLAEQGKKVSLVSPADSVGIDTNDMQREHLAGLLKHLDVSINTAAKVPDDGYVVMATARAPSTVLEEFVDDIRVHSIGTRSRGGRMYEATQSGFWAAAKIGELS
jgi:2,4-dienoyl-CoA reductase (NADPH2)